MHSEPVRWCHVMERECFEDEEVVSNINSPNGLWSK